MAQDAGSRLGISIERLQEALWIAAAVLVPLAINPWGSSAFDLPKAVLLRSLALLLVLLSAFTYLEVPPNLPKSWPRLRDVIARHPLECLALVYFAFVSLATAFSPVPRQSFWGSFERQEGLLTHLSYCALFLFTVTGLRRQQQVERLWLALVWGSLPVVAYGLAQAAGLDPFIWQTDAASPVLSTTGRSNFLGSYLVPVTALTAGRLFAGGKRWPYALLLAGQAFCLLLAQARGAWLGFALATLVFVLGLSYARRSARLRRVTLATAVAGMVLLVLLNWQGDAFAAVPGLGRIATLARTDSGSTAARLTIWRFTVPLILERPWLGYGPDAMRPAFSRVFPPQLVYYQGRHALVDRAHNLWLDAAMTAGVLGALALSAFLAVFFRNGIRSFRQAQDGWRQYLWLSLLAAAGGHLLDMQFSFGLAASETPFWLALAMGAALARIPCHTKGEGAGEAERSPSLSPLYLPPLAISLALTALLAARPLLADVSSKQSQNHDLVPAQRLEAAERAAFLWPLEPEYRLRLALAYAESGNFEAAAIQAGAAIRLQPNDPRLWLARGDVYGRWSAVVPEKGVDAVESLRRAIEMAPHFATYHTLLGLALAGQGNLEEGKQALERAVALDATDYVAYGYLAELYIQLGQQEKAGWAREQESYWRDRTSAAG